MRLQVDLCAEYAGELLLGAGALFAEKMFLHEVIFEVVVRTVVLMEAVGVAEVTIEMVAAQMTEELVVIHIPLIAEFAERMALVTFVVNVAFPTMTRQFRSVVASSLV